MQPLMFELILTKVPIDVDPAYKSKYGIGASGAALYQATTPTGSPVLTNTSSKQNNQVLADVMIQTESHPNRNITKFGDIHIWV
jgi:DNA topoisomerase VI subunit B